MSNSTKTNKQRYTVWSELADNENIKLVEEHNSCNCVLGTKIFPKPAVFAAVIVLPEHWTIDRNGKSGFGP